MSTDNASIVCSTSDTYIDLVHPANRKSGADYGSPRPDAMIRAYKFRMYPTAKQEDLLRAMLDDHRFLYNAALQERREAWKRSRIAINYYAQTGQLSDIRANDPDYARWSFTSQMATLRRLDRAFQAFFRRIKTGEKKAGYPRFKGAGYFDTVVHRNGDGAKWDSHQTQARVRFQGVGDIKVKQHRAVTGRVKTVSAKREGRHWYITLSADQELPAPLPKTGAVVGIDLATGPNGLAYTSLGERIDNPAFGKASLSRLAEANQAMSHTKRGSNRRRKARERVASVHRRVRNQRHDYLHKAAHRLVAGYDVIVAEKLTIAGMTRRPAPRPDGAGGYEPNGGSAKTGLNRSILDAGWGTFLELLRVKAESAGRDFIQVNPAYTSQTCSECGRREAANRKGKDFLCLSCGHRADADINAAVNILRAGLVLRDTA
ncbi:MULTISPECIES: RNA-guided endonuclease InsQ/TnpB family protein [unclassified Pseudarthrobacter]|uniref:RNA-guided endonuclease InsQ/TnpB family protein n=1 Tax=unclassified Pseudarthrobacter TaxID=2647000 RepID=UPI003076C610